MTTPPAELLTDERLTECFNSFTDSINPGTPLAKNLTAMWRHCLAMRTENKALQQQLATQRDVIEACARDYHGTIKLLQESGLFPKTIAEFNEGAQYLQSIIDGSAAETPIQILLRQQHDLKQQLVEKEQVNAVLVEGLKFYALEPCSPDGLIAHAKSRDHGETARQTLESVGVKL
jgi:hypothetical protein